MFFISLFLFSLTNLTMVSMFSSVSMSFLSLNKMSMKDIVLSLSLDWISLSFLSMLFLVTTMVLLYSEVYMEHYDQKKFITILMIFVSSMVLLSLSNSFFCMVLGWEVLGISSVFLVMFYPNKTSMYNSNLTMFFNRMGDIVLMFLIVHIYSNYSEFYYMPILNQNIMWLFFLCSLTKSAQFPLSSWLPAAMSAPTPVSAMVHSSTLVTAGILLMDKTSMFYMPISIFSILSLISGMTFIISGLMANMEKDLKKIVAFSTMSQISLIMKFSSLGMLSLSMAHMISHAFFKTLLFCCCGFSFMMFYSDQMKKKFWMKNLNKNLNLFMMVSIFSMTGLIYSSSFFTKDFFLESSIFISDYYGFLVVLSGSVLTMMYSSTILETCIKSVQNNKILIEKNFHFNYMILFSLILLAMNKIFLNMLFYQNSPIVYMTHLIIVTIVLLGSLILSLNIKMSLILESMMETWSSKIFGYSYWLKLGDSILVKTFSFSDTLMFKPTHFGMGWKVSLKEEKILNLNGFYTLFLMMILLTSYHMY